MIRDKPQVGVRSPANNLKITQSLTSFVDLKRTIISLYTMESTATHIVDPKPQLIYHLSEVLTFKPGYRLQIMIT